MIGDKLILKPYHLPPAREIYNIIAPEVDAAYRKLFIGICGESGSGKSTLAIALKEVLEEHGHASFIFHMDDYFHLPPTTNHMQRMEDINHVGPQEVDLDLLSKHLHEIRSGATELQKPIIHYKENEKRIELVDLTRQSVYILEGTYVAELESLDKLVFIDRTYLETIEARRERARDPFTPFVEEVLGIEHAIISAYKSKADIIVDSDYRVRKQ